MSTIDRPYSPQYICGNCSQMFHVERSAQLHYFCSARTKDEIARDKAIIAEATRQSRALSICRYEGNLTKFKEWVEAVKQMIYKESNPQVKSFQLQKTIGELLSLRPVAPDPSNIDAPESTIGSYAFNECLFLFPELKGLPSLSEYQAEMTEVITCIAERFPPMSPEIHLTQRYHMANLFRRIHYTSLTDPSRNKVPMRDLVDFERAVNSFIDESPICGASCPTNRTDPNRYKKLTVEVDPF